MSYERLFQLHAVAVCEVSLGVSSARQLGFAGHVSSFSTPLRSALPFSFRRSVAKSVICRHSGSYVGSFAAVCGSRRWLRVTNLQRHASCLSTHLRSMFSPGLRCEFDVQTCRASRLDVPPIAAERGFRHSLRASNGSRRRADSSAARFSAPCFSGGAFAGSARVLPRNTKAEVKANHAQQRTVPRVTVAAFSRLCPTRPCAPLL